MKSIFSSKINPALAKRVDLILKGLQVLSIIFGGIYFIVEYRISIHKDRKTETLKFTAKLFDREISEPLSQIGRPFETVAFKVEMDNVLDNSYNNKDICPIKNFYYQKVLPAYYNDAEAGRKFRDSLATLLRFYDSLSICVNSEICDLNTACDFFFYRAKELVTRHCIEYDRYTIQFKYSPAREV
jgi:hypothetical protein